MKTTIENLEVPCEIRKKKKIENQENTEAIKEYDAIMQSMRSLIT